MQRILRQFSTIFAIHALVITVCFVISPSAFAATFSRTLKIGSTGEDVRQLQKILNTDPETRVQEYGPGSPGNETAYFGTLTTRAVIRFQEKYKEDILVPNGLSAGTGIVGPSTRAFLENFNRTQQIGGEIEVSPATSESIPVSQNEQYVSSLSDSNPNKENLGDFLSEVDRVGLQQGYTSSQLETVKKKIVSDVATSVNLKKTFEDILLKSTSYAPVEAQTFLSRLWKSIETSLFPRQAWAISGAPFGGKLLFPFFCSCSGTWLLTIQPLPPTYATLLTYVPGSQAYLTHNIPITSNLLGEYTPGAGICTVYVGVGCAVVPSTGMITPIVGSSPL